MLSRILFYLLGITLISIGLINIIIYFSYINIGYSFFNILASIFKSSSSYILIIGFLLSYKALFKSKK